MMCSLVPRPSLSLSSAITILEAGKKRISSFFPASKIVIAGKKRISSFFPASKIVIAEESEREGLGTRLDDVGVSLYKKGLPKPT